MAARVHKPLKVIAFNARRCELSKQLQDLHIDAALLSETHLKPHDKLRIGNIRGLNLAAVRPASVQLINCSLRIVT
jgi:hypothetical protein